MMVEKIMEKISFMENEYVNAMFSWKSSKEDLDIEIATIQLDTDWKAEGITNAEGRKAFITLHTSDLRDKMHEREKTWKFCEMKLNQYKRELEYEMLLQKKEVGGDAR